MSQNSILLLIFFKHLKNVKTTLGSWAIHKQGGDQFWPAGYGLPTPGPGARGRPDYGQESSRGSPETHGVSRLQRTLPTTGSEGPGRTASPF